MEKLKVEIPGDDLLIDLAEFFKMFGDSTRIKILSALQVSPLNVGELAQTLNMTISAVSHQLRLLKGAKLVKNKKSGKEVYYSLDDDHVTKIMEFGLSHMKESI